MLFPELSPSVYLKGGCARCVPQDWASRRIDMLNWSFYDVHATRPASLFMREMDRTFIEREMHSVHKTE